MAESSTLGFPRIGPEREFKRAVEAYWSGELDEAGLREQCRAVRRENRRLQAEAGLDRVPSNDFSLYDHVLDTAAMVGAVPSRYDWSGERVDLDTYFAMARGVQTESADVPAMEMTKWFDTNYHYIVPEFERGQQFRLGSTKPVDEFLEAKEDGLDTRPVLLGPVSFLLLGKAREDGPEPLSLLGELLPVYEEVLARLEDAGATRVQIDEPCLVLDLDDGARAAYAEAYDRLSAAGIELLVATYFGELRDNLETALALPVDALHLDLVRGPAQLDAALERVPDGMALSLGVVDGRNVWRTNLDRALRVVRRATEALGPERVLVAPSCSLLHSPVDLELEPDLDDELREWLAFAKQKVEEVVLLARAASEGEEAVADEFEASRAALRRRRTSDRTHNERVRRRVAAVSDDMLRRESSYEERRAAQREHLKLPEFPTTTIGSFPQTGEVRGKRSERRRGEIDEREYEAFLEAEIERTVRRQEQIGLDVLVHGESERNDMVQYFGEQLEGFAFTQNGWVQSYGSRCVRPPIIYGDVSRPEPMTTRWSRYAQSLSERPVKGMLTGPVTMLQWSFVRDDQPRSETCFQLALAIRDEVEDLEEAGIGVIQIDEPALREGLPLRREDWAAYLDWAVDAFRLASSGVADETCIHTHMCYSEFNDIIDRVAALDADALFIEAARSRMELLDAFTDFRYPNEIGPGVYDIHSPRVPEREEMEELIEAARERLPDGQLWVNPDCGLKTRRWEEVTPALTAMVEAAREVRERANA